MMKRKITRMAIGEDKSAPSAASGLSDLLDGGSMPLPEEPTPEQLADACMWESHDFGLCDEEERRHRMFAMRENWRAIWKAVNTPGRGSEYMPSN